MENDGDNTIAAIATAGGSGAIGIIRVSGPKAFEVVAKNWRGRPLSTFEERRLYQGTFLNSKGELLDSVLCFLAHAPHTYTGEDLVEIHAHGGRILLTMILETLLEGGARAAQPGEFTERAFRNGRLDLAQAEAIADLIAATSRQGVLLAHRQLEGNLSKLVGKLRNDLLVLRAQMEAMIDFPEEEDLQGLHWEIVERVGLVSEQVKGLLQTYREGRSWREGIRVAIVGKPNVGKSSLLNALVGEERAIVHETPGTTRDLVEEVITLDGVAVRFIDTAGIRQGVETVEAEGIRRSRERAQNSDLVLALFDTSRPLDRDDQTILEMIRDKDSFLILTKVDLPPSFDRTDLSSPSFSVSAVTGEGLSLLKEEIVRHFVGKNPTDDLLITHLRHKRALEKGLDTLRQVQEGATREISLEFLAADLLLATNSLGEITGEITTDEILSEIFSKFCLGK